MKNNFKYIAVILLTVIMSLFFTVSASAEEAAQTVTESIPEENFFSKVYDEISSYTDEIFCALTFVGSLILAFAYKKGLLPLIEKSLLSIGNTVNKIKENTKESADKSGELNKNIDIRLTQASELIERLSERISSLSESLAESLEDEKKARLETKEIRTVTEAQIDMLYSIFMSSALPQYQKDEIGERVAKMKEALAKDEDEK